MPLFTFNPPPSPEHTPARCPVCHSDEGVPLYATSCASTLPHPCRQIGHTHTIIRAWRCLGLPALGTPAPEADRHSPPTRKPPASAAFHSNP